MIESFLNLLPACTAGIVAGLFTGLLPALGPLQVLSVIYLFIQGWTPVELFVFYMSLLTVSQYVDSIPAIYLGVPGETGAIPTAWEGRFVPTDSARYDLIRYCSIGRTVGVVAAMLITLLLIGWISNITWLFSARAQVVLFSLALVGLALTGNNSIWRNIGLMIAGYGLGMIGYNYYLGKEIATFGWTSLYNGLPLIPVIMGIYVLPSLWQHINTTVNDHTKEPVETNKLEFAPVVMRSSTFGYIAGLIPGVSYILSGTGSYNLEKWLQKRRGKYQPGDPNTVVACETGNSVGAFSTMLPLLYFGIPITASEGLIFEMMLKNGAVFQQGAFLSEHLYALSAVIGVVLFFSVLLSWPLSKWSLYLFKFINIKVLYISVGLFCVGSVVFQGWIDNTLTLNLTVLVASLLIGWFLKHMDVLPLLFVMIMQNSIESSVYDFTKIFL